MKQEGPAGSVGSRRRLGSRGERASAVGEAQRGQEPLLGVQGSARELLQATEKNAIQLLRPFPLKVGAEVVRDASAGEGLQESDGALGPQARLSQLLQAGGKRRRLGHGRGPV